MDTHGLETLLAVTLVAAPGAFLAGAAWGDA